MGFAMVSSKFMENNHQNIEFWQFSQKQALKEGILLLLTPFLCADCSKAKTPYPEKRLNIKVFFEFLYEILVFLFEYLFGFDTHFFSKANGFE